MQKEIKIHTPDKHVIYGTLDTAPKKSDKLIIFVHGLAGHKNEHILFNGAKIFNKNGFDAFRFDLYSEPKDARKLSQCTIALHAKDTDLVVRNFRQKYQEVYLVGHSFGGATVLLSNLLQVDGIVLWDASAKAGKYKDWHKDEFEVKNGLKLMAWGPEILLGEAMFKEWLAFPKPKELMKNVSVPVKIICASKAANVPGGREYFRYAKQPKAFAIIRGADHNFNAAGTEERLFAETLDWIKRF